MSEATPKQQTSTRWQIALPNGVPMYFRLIPAGESRMGERGASAEEEPVHRIVIAEDFWMGETPVTQAQFALWTSEEGGEHRNHFADQPDHPADNMDWYQAVRFCEWLTRIRGGELPEGSGEVRLPDEARWEYACRAGTETEYWSGDGEAALAEVGWFDDNADEKTHAVGVKPANAWGLHDMHGNVWEWCADVYDPRAYRKRIDGWTARVWTIEDAGEDADYLQDEDREKGRPFRVLRGGGLGSRARDCRSAFRDSRRPSARFWSLGFRVCLARSSPAQGYGGGAGAGRRGEDGRRSQAGRRGGAGRGKIDLARERLPGKRK